MRSRRCGHDRVHVRRGRTKLGYLDVLTGSMHLTAAQESAAVEAALADQGWMALSDLPAWVEELEERIPAPRTPLAWVI